MTLEQIVDQLKNDRNFMDCVTYWREIPAQAAVYQDYPPELDPRLVTVLRARGFENLFRHQHEAVRQVLAGKNVVIVTPTASGKTLCYNLPVLHSILQNPQSRALYLFPTKALSQDQVAELHEIIAGVAPSLKFDIKSYTFDGDTPPAVRKTIRSAGHIVVTNPDMLHQGIMPHHTLWIKLFENLKYVVIDEIHNYRGVFGSHIANVIRRLKRICRFYGTQPQFILCSATIANPQELAKRVIEEPVEVVDKNGAPRGQKHFILYNPPVINAELGIRKSYIHETRRIATQFIAQNIQTIVFARSRMRVEILVTYLKEAYRRLKKPTDRIRGYRGGYLPLQRREIEHGLRQGAIIGVVSTNALELGIDIGQLAVCVIAGYPGTIASSWQQAGRAGRRLGASIAIMVASSAPLDQYIINNPAYFFERTPEAGIVDPDNLIILLSHIKCAAFELPFTNQEQFGFAFDPTHQVGIGVDTTQEILRYLEENQVVHLSEDKWHWMVETYPAEGVSLRSAAEENVVIIDTTGHQERVIGEIDLFAAQLMVHDEAIYLHESVQYHVDKLDWDRHKAYVQQVDVDHYTDAELKTDLKVLDELESAETTGGWKSYGEVRVTSVAVAYKKVKFHTHENIGWGQILLPEIELHTMAYWYAFDDSVKDALHWTESQLGEGLQALAHVLRNVVPLFVMGDPHDFYAVPMVRSIFAEKPTIYIWERYPGGVGYSRKIFHAHTDVLRAAKDLIEKCGCHTGCPSCVGPPLEVGEQGKTSALQLLAFARVNSK